MTAGRVDQVTAVGALKNHEQRIAALERVPPVNTLVPANVGWIEATTEAFTLPKTTDGAGLDGQDWAVLPIAGTVSPDIKAIAFSNAANTDDPAIGFMPTTSRGDLHAEGYRIFSNHFPLEDSGWDAGDNAGSLRVAAGYPGVYLVMLKALVSGAAAANQTIGFGLATYGGFGDVLSGGWASVGGNGTWSVPRTGSATTSPDPTNIATAYTDPGATQFAVNGYVRAEWQAVVGTRGDDPSDLVVWGWNPGPDDVTVALGVVVLKLDASAENFSD